MKVHLSTLLPGERFRSGDEIYQVDPARELPPGEGWPAILDGSGRPVSSREIFARNGGSFFVLVLPRTSGELAGKGVGL